MKLLDKNGQPVPPLMIEALCSGDNAAEFNWAALRHDYEIVSC